MITALFQNSSVVRMGVANLLLLGGCIVAAVLVGLFAVLQKMAKVEKEAKRTEEDLRNQVLELEFAYEESKAVKEVLEEKLEELKRNEEKNKKIAFTDHITGIPNRLAYTEMLDSVLKTLRKEEQFALMCIDLDDFKYVNETLGHSYGDELLIDVADRMKQALDENDYLACFGGDQFVLLSQNMGGPDEYSEKIKKVQKLFSFPFNLAAQEIFVAVSIGICIAPKDGKTTQTLLKNLDSALHAAKCEGKNTYCYYDESINQDLMEKIELQSQLRNAIDNQEFQVYYQPQMDVENNIVIGFEALARWNHPVKGVLLPADFISTAEKSGLIIPIGNFVLRTACIQLKKWMDAGFDRIYCSVNLSSRQFRDQKLLPNVMDMLSETGADPEHLQLEITESIALEDVEYSISMIERFKDKGIHFILDDYGSKYVSINYLQQLPADSLKIDQDCMEHLLENPNSRAMVEAILHMAEALGLRVIAEGVESSEQELFLKKAGCHYAQGFLYSEAIHAEDAGNLLQFLKNGGNMADFYWR